MAWGALVAIEAYKWKMHSQTTCSHDEGAAFVYHSLEKQGRLWNRVCWRCGKHEHHWTAAGVPRDWPPAGARLKRGESTPDLANRPTPIPPIRDP